ncbi:MAG TPA: hypothetical protein VE443_01090 [Beijerinckiaceae bacterium]|nr:hypothetical protein [Beijerinckiaceae bacterium]
MFQAVLTAATQDGDMAAAKLLIDRVIPSRRGAPVSFHIRPLKTPEDCALAYADLLDDVGRDRSPEGAARRHCWASTPAVADPPPVGDHLTCVGPGPPTPSTQARL